MKLLKTHWYPQYDVILKKKGQGRKKTFLLHTSSLLGAESINIGRVISGDKLVGIQKHRRYYKWVI